MSKKKHDLSRCLGTGQKICSRLNREEGQELCGVSLSCVVYFQRAGLQNDDSMNSGILWTALWLARLQFPIASASHMSEEVPDILPEPVGPGPGPGRKLERAASRYNWISKGSLGTSLRLVGTSTNMIFTFVCFPVLSVRCLETSPFDWEV